MENVTISVKRFEELLHKEAAYEMKKQDLKMGGYIPAIDRMLFGITEEKQEAEPEAEKDDF